MVPAQHFKLLYEIKKSVFLRHLTTMMRYCSRRVKYLFDVLLKSRKTFGVKFLKFGEEPKSRRQRGTSPIYVIVFYYGLNLNHLTLMSSNSVPRNLQVRFKLYFARSLNLLRTAQALVFLAMLVKLRSMSTIQKEVILVVSRFACKTMEYKAKALLL